MPGPAAEQPTSERTPARAGRALQMTLAVVVIAGLLLLLARGFVQSILNDNLPRFEAVIISVIVLALIALVGSLVRERLREYRTDRYRDIER